MPLDGVKRTHESDGFLCDLGSRLFRLDHLATQMRPTSSAHDGVAGHHAVVSTIGIGQKHLIVILEEILRSVAPAAEREVEHVIRMRRIAHVDPHPRLGAVTGF